MTLKETLFPACCAALFLSSCLTVKYKEYHINLRTDTAGDAVVRFVDIGSASDDTANVSQDDFRQLIEFYVEGNGLEREYPGVSNVTKRLFEEHEVLCGEIRFSFDSLSVLGLFRYDSLSPLMYYPGGENANERILETNGRMGGERMPVVFWPARTPELFMRTRTIGNGHNRRSLLREFQQWEERKPHSPSPSSPGRQ